MIWVEAVVGVFMLATGFAGSPQSAASSIEWLERRAEKRRNRA